MIGFGIILEFESKGLIQSYKTDLLGDCCPSFAMTILANIS